MGERRILYMNTCDPSLVWTTSHCDNQDHPRLVLQNLTFIDGNATGETVDGGGGGAVFVRGGRVRVVNSRFFSNRCDSTGPDVVSNDRNGAMSISDSVLRSNPSLGFETRGYPGIFVLAPTPPTVVDSIIE